MLTCFLALRLRLRLSASDYLELHTCIPCLCLPGPCPDLRDGTERHRIHASARRTYRAVPRRPPSLPSDSARSRAEGRTTHRCRSDAEREARDRCHYAMGEVNWKKKRLGRHQSIPARRLASYCSLLLSFALPIGYTLVRVSTRNLGVYGAGARKAGSYRTSATSSVSRSKAQDQE